jgi:hypothetical protein
VRRYNARRVKVHRNYTVEEAAKLFGAQSTIAGPSSSSVGNLPALCMPAANVVGSAVLPVSFIASSAGSPGDR